MGTGCDAADINDRLIGLIDRRAVDGNGTQPAGTNDF